MVKNKYKRTITKDSEIKNSRIHIGVSDRLKQWLKDHKYSPTSIFYEKVREIGYEI